MSVLGKALGEGFIDELSDFAVAFQGFFLAFQERGIVAEKILRDPQTSFLVVSGADPVRVAEAEEFSRTLSELGITARAFIANRVHTSASTDVKVQVDAAAVRAAFDGFGGVKPDAERVAAALQGAQWTRAALARRDRSGLARLAETGGRDKLLVVPELDQEVEDRGAIEHLLHPPFTRRPRTHPERRHCRPSESALRSERAPGWPAARPAPCAALLLMPPRSTRSASVVVFRGGPTALTSIHGVFACFPLTMPREPPLARALR